MAATQLNALLRFFSRLKLRSPFLLLTSPVSFIIISLAFPQTKLKLTSGFLTLLYTFFIWVNLATHTAISHRETKFKDVLLYNGMSIFLYTFAFFILEFIFLTFIVILCLVLQLIAQHNKYTFYFEKEQQGMLAIGLFGFGLCYLSLALLLSQCLSDQFTLLFINIFSLTLLFIAFGTTDMQPLQQPDIGHYYYFGYNYVFRQIHNFYIAYFGALILALFYLIIELWRHSLFFRAFIKNSCNCCKKTQQHYTNLYIQIQSDKSYAEFDYLMRLDQVTKKYGSFRALQNVSLYIPKNQITCVVGKNGSGKTTLLRILTGHQNISRGGLYLKIDGDDAPMSSSFAILPTGFCPQQNNMPPTLTLAQLSELFSSFNAKGREFVNENKFKRENLLKNLKLQNHYKDLYQTLSIGVRRKVALYLALVNHSPLILLDEPVMGLNDKSQKEFWDILEMMKSTHTIVVITHNLNAAQDCADYCGILHKGSLIHFSSLADLKAQTHGLLVLRARCNPLRRTHIGSYTEQTEYFSLTQNYYFRELTIKSNDLSILLTFLHQNENMIFTVNRLNLQSLVISKAESKEPNYSLTRRKDISILLETEVSHFYTPRRISWIMQILVLFSRRSRLLWLNFRNFGGVFSCFLDVVLSSYLFRIKDVFIFYRLISGLTVIAVQETVQRSVKKFTLIMDTSGISSFQYQLANLFAHTIFYIFVYLLLFLFLELTGKAFFNLHITEAPFMLMLLLGIVASMSFSQFVSIFFKDPNIALGVFLLIVEYYSFFLFKTSFTAGYFFPNMFFCFAISQQISNSVQSRNIHYKVNLSYQFQILVLILQTVVYFVLAVLFDKYKRGTLCPRKNLARNFLNKFNIPISGHFQHNRSHNEFKLDFEKGSVTSILGPTESGKSELINLLIGNNRISFNGNYYLHKSNILKGEPLPPNMVGVCLDEDYLEQSFTLFYHLCFLGYLKGLQTKQMLRQIFYLAKLFDMEDHLFKKIKHLSGGNKRKAALSAALLGAPPLFIMDEPTRSLDPAVARQILLALHFFVNRLGKTLVFSSKKENQVLLISHSVLSLPAPQEEVLEAITIKPIEDKVSVSVRYYIPPGDYESEFPLRNLNSRLKDILNLVLTHNGEIIEISLNTIQSQKK